jgi:hypothetical protein
MSALEYKGKAVDVSSLEFGDFDYREENPWLESAYYMDGTPLTDSEMDDISDDKASELHMIFMNDFLY